MIPAQKAEAVSLNLDSIAEWGKFPRFCVNTYRWGDKFFNSYDSTYVVGSGKRMNIKTRLESATDIYNFEFSNKYRMEMVSQPSLSMGFYLTYMAISVGYDMNIAKYFNGNERARRRFNFQFNCSLFAAEFYTMQNDVGTTIHRMGPPEHVEHTKIDFRGINTNFWGLDIYYFFNHKHYSQAAAFCYSKIQVKSSGSLFAGLSFWEQQYDFDFNSLANELFGYVPETWNLNYNVKNKNYALKFGYAYNWVFHPGWCVGISEAPTIGIRQGYINQPGHNNTSFALNNRLRASIVYNHNKRWFFGIVGTVDTGLIYDTEHSLINSNLIVEASAGFRFDLW